MSDFPEYDADAEFEEVLQRNIELQTTVDEQKAEIERLRAEEPPRDE